VHVVAQDQRMIVWFDVRKIPLVQEIIWVNAAWICWQWWVALAVISFSSIGDEDNSTGFSLPLLTLSRL
jgi:hypothetical protein